MKFEKAPAISLGTKSRGKSTYNGKEYPGYFAFTFALESEPGDIGRKIYADGPLQEQICKHAANFGERIFISGDIDNKGKITVTDVSPMTDFEEYD